MGATNLTYAIKDIGSGRVEFQASLNKKAEGGPHLLEQVYYQAGKLETLREAMYAGKYFDSKDGAFKLVFYPASGQLEPAKVR